MSDEKSPDFQPEDEATEEIDQDYIRILIEALFSSETDQLSDAPSPGDNVARLAERFARFRSARGWTQQRFTRALMNDGLQAFRNVLNLNDSSDEDVAAAVLRQLDRPPTIVPSGTKAETKEHKPDPDYKMKNRPLGLKYRTKRKRADYKMKNRPLGLKYRTKRERAGNHVEEADYVMKEAMRQKRNGDDPSGTGGGEAGVH